MPSIATIPVDHAEPIVRRGLARVEIEVRTHAGEFVQGMFRDGMGAAIRALLSASCSAFTARGVFEPDRTGSLNVIPASKTKALRAALLMRDQLGASWLGGVLRIGSNIPSSRGGGESTGDVLVAAKAVAAALGIRVDAATYARTCVLAEVASDGIMFEGATLFRQRDGIIIEDFGGPVPPGTVLAFDSAPESAGVDTLQLKPAEYTGEQIATFEVLRSALRRAISDQSIELLARVSTASAEINQGFLPNRAFDILRYLVARGVSLGMVVAHSGTLAGAIFAPGDVAGIAEARRVLIRHGAQRFWMFPTAPRPSLSSVAA